MMENNSHNQYTEISPKKNEASIDTLQTSMQKGHCEIQRNEMDHKGSLLKKARESKGLSLESVHEGTKIPLDALRAIEEGYTVRTLSSFYYKGFVKIYASYLDLDIKEVMDDHRKEELPKYVKKNVEDLNVRVEVKQWLSKILTHKRKRQGIILFCALLALIIVFKIAGYLIGKLTHTGAKVENTEQPPMPKVKKTTPSAVPEKVPASPVKASAGPVVADYIMLTVRAQKDSWLRVKVDGEIQFQATLREGVVETWKAKERIEISGKNIHQLEFELNGKLIGTLGRGDRKAKGVIITREGLSVTK